MYDFIDLNFFFFFFFFFFFGGGGGILYSETTAAFSVAAGIHTERIPKSCKYSFHI